MRASELPTAAHAGMLCIVGQPSYRYCTELIGGKVTFSSAIVLMASLKCSMLDIESNQVDFQTRWDHCLAILEHYQDRVQSASHAINSLKAVQMRIFQNDHVQGTSQYHLTSILTSNARHT